MTINKEINGTELVLALDGRLDTTTAPALEKVFNESLPGIKSVVLDFTKLEYISSAGLRVLLAAQKVMNKQGTMKLIGVGETVMEVFEVTGFTDILNIE